MVVEGFVDDFEISAWQALGTFPGKAIKGCVFHWTQAIWRHVQMYGLVPQAIWRHVQMYGLVPNYSKR